MEIWDQNQERDEAITNSRSDSKLSMLHSSQFDGMEGIEIGGGAEVRSDDKGKFTSGDSEVRSNS